MTDRHTADTITSDALDELYARAEQAETRLRLAHEARRAKEHQLDGIRRAMCDAGLMQDNDPYSHADLEDVIRQAAPAPTATEASLRARLEGTHTRLLALATDLEHPKHRGEYGIPHPVVAVMIRDALGREAPAATEATGPFIDRPFRSHRTPTPACACTYGERCPNCRA